MIFVFNTCSFFDEAIDSVKGQEQAAPRTSCFVDDGSNRATTIAVERLAHGSDLED